METYFHGARRRRSYFEGWYLKQQTRDGRSLALIPAFHIDGQGRPSASLQVIAGGQSWRLDYPAEEFQAAAEVFRVRLGENLFDSEGVRLAVEQEGLSLHGTLRYGPFAPLRSDIMGPFRFLGGMECAHGVLSMGHWVEGTVTLNGESLRFSEGIGYAETDRGRSFPDTYLWSQCLWGEGTGLMLAVASIPLPVGAFTGCICAVIHGGREYRLATYRGIRVKRWSAAGAELRQGEYRLLAEVLGERPQLLRAPVKGGMDRTVRESLQARVRYRFWAGEELLFDHTDDHASFEYAGPGEGAPGRTTEGA